MPLSSLAPLAGLGSAFGEVSALADRQRQMQIRETLAAIQQSQARQQQQQFQQQQQALSGIGNLFGSGQLNNLMGGQGPQPAGPGGGGFAPQGGMNSGMFGPGTLTPPAPPRQQMAGLPQLTDAIYDLETSRGQNVSTSPAGALGPMQVMPDTARQYGATPQDAADPVKGKQLGDMIVGDLYKKYGGNPDLTAIAYNAGPGRADKIQAGAPISSLPGETQAYLTKLHRDLDLNMSPEQRQQTQASAQNAARQIPNILQTAGSWNMDGLAKLIEKTNPDASPEVKGAIFLKMAPLLSEQAKTQAANIFKTYEAGEHQYEFDTSKGLQEKEFQARREDTAAQREATAAFRAATLGQGQQKIDISERKAKAGELPPDAIEILADQGFQGDTSWKTNLGRGAQGAENIAAVQKRIAEKVKAAGQTGGDLATREAEFGGLKAGERTLSTRTANIGMRINEAQRFAPLALQASNNVDRTQYPTFNKLEEAYLEGTGDQDVVRLMVYSQSFMNAYAAAVTPTGQPTEGAQARARSNLSIAWAKGQYQAAVEAMLVEMDAASKSPGTVREEFRKGAAAPAPGGQPVTGPTGGGLAPDWSSMSNEELIRRAQQQGQ